MKTSKQSHLDLQTNASWLKKKKKNGAGIQQRTTNKEDTYMRFAFRGFLYGICSTKLYEDD
jgi:hypothetical protein